MSKLIQGVWFQFEQCRGGSWSKSERLASLALAYYYLAIWALANAIHGSQMHLPRKKPEEGHCYH